MTAEEFELLLLKVAPIITRRNTKMRQAVSAQERLAVTLRFLATGESFASFHFQYRLGESTISQIVTDTCEALHQTLKDDYLTTPNTEEEWRKVASGFEEKWQFPHCLGAIDGKHIRIQPPANSGSTYYNYKSFFSVQMMAVVDAQYRFIYVSVGAQGRASDAGIFAQSDLKAALDAKLLSIPQPNSLPGTHQEVPYVLVGDEAFPLRLDLMKPFPFRLLNTEQRIFNYRLSRARRVVENGFGILANRWRVFRTTIALHPDKVVRIALACVCLHNFLRTTRSEVYLPPALADWEDGEHTVVEGTWRKDGLGAMQSFQQGYTRNSSMAAKELRNTIKMYFLTSAGQVPWQQKYM
ncbi:hypothetical protein ACEWY4_012579 [Coilia grayii]|uniref:DDE Tnp4 domain-containing protein n=1 Tax=Coilia grayii TaxID=363190 RepID=A0ABD1K0X7_9TELE